MRESSYTNRLSMCTKLLFSIRLLVPIVFCHVRFNCCEPTIPKMHILVTFSHRIIYFSLLSYFSTPSTTVFSIISKNRVGKMVCVKTRSENNDAFDSAPLYPCRNIADDSLIVVSSFYDGILNYSCCYTMYISIECRVHR